jgi:transposase
MAPIKKRVEKEGGKKKEMITVEIKKEIIGKHEEGMQVAVIARFYKKSTSTISTVLKKKELTGLDVAKGVMRVSKQQPRILKDVEKLLLVWINKTQLAGDSVTENLSQQIAVTPLVTMNAVLPSN